MKVPFTPFQLILTVLNIAGFIFCTACDAFVLAVDRNTMAYRPFVVNMILCGLALILFIVLVFNTRIVNVFGDKTDPDADPAPALSAARTYFCLLFFDFAGVLVLMLAGAFMIDWAKKAILIFAPSVFVISAAVYFFLSGRIGLSDFSDEDNDDDSGDDVSVD